MYVSFDKNFVLKVTHKVIIIMEQNNGQLI